MPDEATIDKLAHEAGAKPRLNELNQKKVIEGLDYSDKSIPDADGKNPKWKVTCKTTYNGKVFTQSAARESKKKSAEVAAYLVHLELKKAGLTDEH